MDNSNVAPFPALPRHLNPYVLTPSRIGRRFAVQHVPSPLRHGFGPEDVIRASEGHRCYLEDDSNDRMAVNEEYAGPYVTVDERIAKAPPGLECSHARISSRVRFSDEIQQTIDSFRSCVAYVYDCAQRDKFILSVKNLALEHTGLCLEILGEHLELLESEMKRARNFTELNTVGIRKQALENEIWDCKAQRERIVEIPPSRASHNMRKS